MPRSLFRTRTVVDPHVLTLLFNYHDPQGLVKAGAPYDEYDSEVKMLEEWFNLGLRTMWQDVGSITAEEILEQIYAIFCYQFTPNGAGNKEGYEPMAKEIFSLCCKI